MRASYDSNLKIFFQVYGSLDSQPATIIEQSPEVYSSTTDRETMRRHTSIGC